MSSVYVAGIKTLRNTLHFPKSLQENGSHESSLAVIESAYMTVAGMAGIGGRNEGLAIPVLLAVEETVVTERAALAWGCGRVGALGITEGRLRATGDGPHHTLTPQTRVILGPPHGPVPATQILSDH